MNLAPIILFAYDRPDHLQKTINALAMNELCAESALYVFVDGPKVNASYEQIARIEKVRDIVSKIKCCKSVIISIAWENKTCRMSIIKGISQVLEMHESAIVLEDDIITAPNFLLYMNKCLGYYKNRKTVYSISAYCPPPNKIQIPNNYPYDVFAFGRPFNWGWGTWADRWFQESWDKDFIPDFLKRKEEVQAFNRAGDDLSKMLSEEYYGKSDAWDIQFSFTHFANHGLSIVPCNSYTTNIGLDGSGTHCNIDNSNYSDLSLCKKNPKLLDYLYVNKEIANSIYSYFYAGKRPLWKKAINRMSRMVGRKSPFIIKAKIYR